MKIDLTDMLYALSFALDAVEHDLLGVSTEHGKRVAYLSLRLAEACGIAGTELLDFVGCTILHDNALAEFVWEECKNAKDPMEEGKKAFTLKTGRHCEIGEKNIRLIPFRSDLKDVILYHHENADGSGPLGKTQEETNLKSQLLHMADGIDMGWDLRNMTEEEYIEMSQKIQKMKGSIFSSASVEAFCKVIDYATVVKLQEKGVRACLTEALPTEFDTYSETEVRNLAEFFMRIIYYKSPFTRDHSRAIAEKAETMAKFYNFSPEKRIRFYFAAAMHDIGKLIVRDEILEKPAKLNADEFEKIKSHPVATYVLLHAIKDMDDITAWASHHHEKLDGSGYPFGLSAKDLSHEERLMACVDIYEALREKRPYKDVMTHQDTIKIMRDMAEKGQIDKDIVNDMDKVFANT